MYLFHFLLFFFGKNKLFDFQKFLCDNQFIEPLLWTVHGDINNFNIALPDSYATYKGSFICINDNDIINVDGIVPKSRYYSFQIYDSTTASLGSINDDQIILENKTNYKLSITKSKLCESNNFEQNKNTLYISTNDTFLLFIFRLYDIDDNYNFTLPKITKNNKLLIPAKNYTKIHFSFLYRNTKPVREHKFANEDNNFFKPVVQTFFHNSDADYLISLIKVNQTNPICAIINGVLPIVKINNSNNYDVRYISFNMGTTSSFLPTIAGNMLTNNKLNDNLISSSKTAGIMDKHIIEKYKNSNDWINNNRSYVIYVGGTIEQIKSLGCNPDKDLYLLYPKMTNEKYFTYASILHRHLMPQKKLKNKRKYITFNNSINNIGGQYADPKKCESVMKQYYPKIKFIKCA